MIESVIVHEELKKHKVNTANLFKLVFERLEQVEEAVNAWKTPEPGPFREGTSNDPNAFQTTTVCNANS